MKTIPTNVRLIFTMLAILAALLAAQDSLATAYTSAAGGGNWNLATTWTPSGVPGSGDTAAIAAADPVSVSDAEAALSITIQKGATLTVGTGGNLTVTGTITQSGGTSGTSTVTLAGGAGTLTLNAVATAFTTVTLTPGTAGSTVNYGAAGATVYAAVYDNLMLSGGGTVTVNSTTTAINLLMSGTTVISNGSGKLSSITGNVTLNNTAAFTAASTETIGGSVTLNGTSTFTVTANTTVGGSFTVNTGCFYYNNNGNAGLTIAGNVVVAGVFGLTTSANNASTVTLTGTGGTISGGGTMSNQVLTVTGSYTILPGTTVSVGNKNAGVTPLLGGSGSLANQGTLIITFSSALSSAETLATLTCSPTSGTVVLIDNNGGAATVPPLTYDNLTLNATAGSASAFNLGGSGFSTSGNLTFGGASGATALVSAWPASGGVSGQVIFNSPEGITFPSTFSIGGLAQSAGTVTVPANGTLTVAGTGVTINGGTLVLAAASSISSTQVLAIGAGGTFNVSASSSYTMSGGTCTGLSASGTGATAGTTAATIKGPASGAGVSLGTQPIQLNFTPTIFTGDTTHPALLVSQGALTLNGNLITVNNATATPLGLGTYRLIQVTGGSVTGTPNGTPVITGTGLAAGTVASISVSSGDVNLLVQNPTSTALTLSAGSSPSTYGGSLTFAAVVTPTPDAGSVQFRTNGVNFGSAVTLGGGTANLTTTALPYNASAYTVTAVYSGDASYRGSTSGSLSQTVNQAGLTIIGLTGANKPYDGTTSASFTGTAAYSGLVNGESFPVAGIPSASFISAALGTGIPINVTGFLAPSANYSLTEPSLAGNITSAPLTVTANSASKIYGQTVTFAGTEFTISGLVTGDSVSSVTLTSAGATNTAPVAGSTYPIVPSAAVGTGLGNYNVSYASGSLTVSPAVLGVTANDTNEVYGATNPVFTATYTGFVNGESVTNSDVGGDPELTTLATTNSPVGAYVITNTLGSLTSTNYTFSFTNGTLTVLPAAITVTANSLSQSYGAVTPALTASYAGFVNGDTAAVISGSPGLSADVTTNSPVGAYDIAASLGSLSATNYAFTLVDGMLSVTQASLTITADDTNKVYGQALSFVGTEFTTAGLANGETVGTVSLIAAGGTNATDAADSYTITPSAATGGTFNPANYAITYDPGTLTVNPLGVTVTADPQTEVYGTADPALTYEFSPALVGSDSLSGALARVTGAAVGSYAIGQGTLALDTNYSLSFVSANLTITPAALTVTASSASKVYGQTVTFAGTEFTTGGLFSGDSISSVTLASPGATNTAPVAGSTYPITASAAVGTGLGNYNIAYIGGSLTVNPALLGVTANNTNEVYGATNPVFTVTYTGFVAGDSLTNSDVGGEPELTTSAATNSPVGAYVITNTLGSLTSTNYAFSFTNGTLTVVQAAITVTASSLSQAYGTVAPALTASYAGFVNGDTTAAISGSPGLSADVTTNSPVGAYDIAASLGSLSATNYAFTLVDGTLSVTQASLTIMADDTNKVYGQALSFAGTEFTAVGLANGETVETVSLIAAGGTNVTDAAASYTITPSAATGGTFNPANYAIIYASGTLMVNPLGVTVTADPQTEVYGTDDPALTYEFAPALVGSDNFSGALTRAAGAAVGSHAIGQGSLALSANYSLSFVGANLTITPAPLTVTASSASKVYGQTVTFAGTEFTTSGLLNSDSVSTVTLSSTGATNTAAVGDYAILISGATGSGLGNYNISYNDGTLTVTAATPVIINSPVVLGDGTIELTFTGGDAGASYEVQASTNLSVWTTLTTTVAGTNGLPGYIDIGATNNGLRFYRTTTP